MNRRKARENTFIILFESSFGDDIETLIELSQENDEDYQIDSFGRELLALYQANKDSIDSQITQRLKKGWRVDRLPRVNLALLRLAVTEMLYATPDMDSVVINEAVELAKKYGDDEAYQFINGVLGSISRENKASASTANVEE